MLQASFLLLSIFATLFLVQIANYKSKKAALFTFVGLLLWQLFIFLITVSGFTVSLDFPPRFALLFILPSFIFSAFLLSKIYKSEWVRRISIKELILFQSFRIGVELCLFWASTNGIVNALLTFEGYNFDLIFGLSAILIYLYLFQLKKQLNKTLLLFWNYLGILVLFSVIFVFASTIYLPKIYGYETTPITTEFLKYPYILVAAFLMPSAIFIHLLSIIKLKNEY